MAVLASSISQSTKAWTWARMRVLADRMMK
jgi:hypothetical protein